MLNLGGFFKWIDGRPQMIIQARTRAVDWVDGSAWGNQVDGIVYITIPYYTDLLDVHMYVKPQQD